MRCINENLQLQFFKLVSPNTSDTFDYFFDLALSAGVGNDSHTVQKCLSTENKRNVIIKQWQLGKVRKSEVLQRKSSL